MKFLLCGSLITCSALLGSVTARRVLAEDVSLHAHEEETTSAIRNYHDRWMYSDWSKDGAEFKAARLALDASTTIQTSEDQLRTLVDKFQQQVDANPKDQLKQFKLIYLCYRAAVVLPSCGSKQLRRVRGLLEQQEYQTFEQARLRFVIEARDFPSLKLIFIGKRLLKAQPDDYDVKFYLVNVLDPSRSEQEAAEALIYSEELINAFPLRPSAHSALGGTLYKTWLRTQNKATADRSIAAYEQYLKLAPENDSFREQAQKLMAIMQRTVHSPTK